MKRFMRGFVLHLFLFSAAYAQWLPQHSGTAERINDILFSTSSSGLACGSGATLLKTSDRGFSWHKIPLSSGLSFNALANLTGRFYLVGDSGSFFISRDGGSNWTEQPSNTHLDLNSIFFIDESTGWIAGDSGLVLYTDDGGESWLVQQTPTHASLNSIIFLDQQNGFAAGSAGTLLKTSNSGYTWQAVPSGSLQNLNKIVFNNRLHGFIAGDSGTILYSPDSGGSWTARPAGTDFNLYSVSIIDSLHLWIAGGKNQQGLLLKSNDGGQNWTKNSSTLFSELHSVFFQDMYSGFCAGEHGAVLHTQSGGMLPPATPLLQEPQNDFITRRLQQDLSWQPVQDAEHYRLQVAGDFRFEHIFFEDSLLLETQISIDNLELETTYYWRVKAKNILGASPWSDSRRFSTPDRGPLLSSPANAQQQVSVPAVFIWQEKENAQKYWLQIAYDADFSQLAVSDSTLQDNRYTAEDLYYQQKYYWRMRSRRAGYFSVWSDTFSFTTANNLEGWSSQWSGTKSSLKDVFFHDDRRGWIAGTSGKLLSTNNGGASWQYTSLPTSAHLESIQFLNDSTGWICGWSGKILKTTDGGQNWNTQPSGTSFILRDLSFCDSLCGWAVGERGLILKTTNGGQNWTTVSNITSNEYYQVYFSSPDTDWIVGANWNGAKYNSLILYTNNGGQIWTSQSFTSVDFLSSLFFVNSNKGWAVGGDGSVLHTTDGGIQWTIQHQSAFFDLYSVFFIDEQNGWAVGNNGVCVHTADGGQSWDFQKTPAKSPLHSIIVNPSGKAWIVGGNGTILQTASSGYQMVPEIIAPADRAIALSTQPLLRWRSVPLVEHYHLQLAADLSFQELLYDNPAVSDTALTPGLLAENKNYYWRVRSSYQQLFSAWSPVFRFTTGGVWLRQESPVTLNLNDVFFADMFNGIIVGDKGSVLRTEDGGADWQTAASPVRKNLHSLFFNNSNQGWAVGDSGTIIKTIDAGRNWSLVPTTTSLSLKAVFFVGPDTGWVVGGGKDSARSENHAVILKTSNGGQSWIMQMPDQPALLNDVFFTDPCHGWAVGGGGEHKLLKTTDGGQNWTVIEIAGDDLINKVYFSDSLNGYLAGNKGRLLKTCDGGENWQAIEIDSLADIHDFCFPGAGRSLVLANGLFTSKDSGATWDVQFFESRASFNSIVFASEESGWIVGDEGLILKTSSSGFPVGLAEDEGISLAESFKLLQNYPNPFNPETVIGYQLAVGSSVELAVYNILGQKVKTLLNKRQNAGDYRLRFNASDLASGVYLYRIKAGRFIQTRKMILLR